MAKRVKTKKGSIGKKALAAILAASMVLSSSAFTVFASVDEAAPAADMTDKAYQGTVDVTIDGSSVIGGRGSGAVSGDITQYLINGKYTEYDGSRKLPVITEITEHGNGANKLTENRDYSVSYGENTNAGTGTIDITFLRNLNGNKNYEYVEDLHFTFTISGFRLDKEATDVDVKVGEPDNREYTGEKMTPNVTVTAKVGTATKTLVLGTDYELVGDDEKPLDLVECGTYNVYAKGIGSYTGVSQDYDAFEIRKAPLENSRVTITTTDVLMRNASVLRSNLAKAITVKDSKTGKSLAIANAVTAGYDVQWKDAVTGEYKAAGANDSVKTPGTYDFRIVPNSDTKNFAGGSATGSVRVVDAMDLQQMIDNYPLDEDELTMAYTGKNLWTGDNGLENKLKTELRKWSFNQNGAICEIADKDLNLVDAGTYEINLRGLLGHNNETAKVKVKINPATINTETKDDVYCDCTDRNHAADLNTATKTTPGINVTIKQGTSYSGNATKPVVAITHITGDAEPYKLVEGTDYTYTTETVGTNTVVKISGLKNYTTKGSATFDVTIKSKDRHLPLDSDIIQVVVKNVKYNAAGTQVTDAELEVWDTERNYKLQNDVDYVLPAVTEADYKDGKLRVTIAEKNRTDNTKWGYEGSRTVEIGIDGEDEIANRLYLEDFNDLYVIDSNNRKYDVSDIETLVKQKLKYIDGKGVYIQITEDHRNKIEIKVTDADGKEYTGDLPAGKEYTVEVRAAKGRFNGSLSKKFRVIGLNIQKGLTVSAIPDQAYTGKEVTPSVVVTWNGKAYDKAGNELNSGNTMPDFKPDVSNGSVMTLKEGVDYTMSYVDNVDEGIAKAVVTIIGTYSGTAEKYFNIKNNMGTLTFTDPAQKTLLENGVKVGSDAVTLGIAPAKADSTIKYTYESSDAAIVAVDDKGVLTFNDVGTAVITVSAASDNVTYAPLQVTVKVVKDEEEPSENIKTPSCTPSRLKNVKNSFTVTTNTVKGADKWIIRYSLKNLNKTTKGSAKVTFKNTKKVNQKVVKVNKSGAKYYVQCRVIKNGVKSKWSKVKTVTSR